MKTISGHCVSLKEISLSKAAKILSKFVSAENGASHVISAYLHRASASFNELDHLHKELKSSRSHKKKNKGHTTETDDDSGRVVENSVRSVETNQELNPGKVQSVDEFRRQRFGSEYADDDDEKSAQTVVKFSQELDGSIGYQAGNVGGSEKHKKNKKKKQEVESRDRDSGVKFGEREGDEKPSTVEKNEIFSGREQGNEDEKQKKEKKKKHKDGNCNFSGNKGEVENLEGDNTDGQEQQKEIEKKLFNSVEGENGGLVGPQDLQIKKKRKHEAGNESKLYAEEVKMEQRRKRKNEDVEGRQEDRSGDLSKKRKGHTTETDDDSGRVVENSVRSVETNQELNPGKVQSVDEFRRQQFGSEYADDDDEKSAQTVVKFSQELDCSIGYQAGNVGGSEKHKKNKKKKQEVESRHDRDSGVKFGEREGDEKPSNVEKNEIFSGREQGNEGEKQKKEKKKKHKDGNRNFSSNKGEVENLEGENTEGQEQQKEIEKKLFNSVEGENGGLVGPQDLQIKKKRKHEAGNESKLYAEEVKMEQRRKRKNEDVEGRQEDRSGDLSKKRMKRKHQSDPQF